VEAPANLLQQLGAALPIGLLGSSGVLFVRPPGARTAGLLARDADLAAPVLV
jgi:hypothetical protein